MSYNVEMYIIMSTSNKQPTLTNNRFVLAHVIFYSFWSLLIFSWGCCFLGVQELILGGSGKLILCTLSGTQKNHKFKNARFITQVNIQSALFLASPSPPHFFCLPLSPSPSLAHQKQHNSKKTQFITQVYYTNCTFAGFQGSPPRGAPPSIKIDHLGT